MNMSFSPEHTDIRPEEAPVMRLTPEFRYNSERPGSSRWPTSIEFRGMTFLLHYQYGNGTAYYDTPSGSRDIDVVVDEEGFVVGGTYEGRKWETVAEEFGG